MEVVRATETLELIRIHGSAYHETVTRDSAVSVCVSVSNVLRPALVSGEHINMKKVIYSFINAGQSKIYLNFTIKY